MCCRPCKLELLCMTVVSVIDYLMHLYKWFSRFSLTYFPRSTLSTNNCFKNTNVNVPNLTDYVSSRFFSPVYIIRHQITLTRLVYYFNNFVIRQRFPQLQNDLKHLNQSQVILH